MPKEPLSACNYRSVANNGAKNGHNKMMDWNATHKHIGNKNASLNKKSRIN